MDYRATEEDQRKSRVR